MGGGIAYESKDQVTLDLIAQQLWAGYHRAHEQARRGASLDRQVFVETLAAEWQGVLKKEVLNRLELSPTAFGATAIPSRAVDLTRRALGQRQDQPQGSPPRAPLPD